MRIEITQRGKKGVKKFAARGWEAPVESDGESQMCILLDGHSDYYCEEGKGAPVLIEMREDGPYVVIWADINQEDPTHVISLAGARESARKPEPIVDLTAWKNQLEAK